ncbi:hypothetical protein MMC15_003202 [Xylographa vitiligo]|nr:hypothetical protein [Xylographa vitiligo]
MKTLSVVAGLLASTSVAAALSIPHRSDALERRGFEAEDFGSLDAELGGRREGVMLTTYLTKRGGGGGDGGGGDGGGDGGGGGGGGSGDGGGEGGGEGEGSGNGEPSSSSSSSSPPTYGGGRYYGGGSSTPYPSGSRSPAGISPQYLTPPSLDWYPGYWPYGAYAYAYPHPCYFVNASAGSQNQSLPVECLCEAYCPCGCDDNGDGAFVQSIVGDGVALNAALVRTSVVDGRKTLVINGTLANGTAGGATGGAGGWGGMRTGGLLVVGAVVGMIVGGL